MKTSGIFLPIHSLPSKHGTGGFEEAKKFITFLATARQECWQTGTIHPTNFEQQFCVTSVFAGNPLYIDFQQLVQDGLIKQKDYDNWCSRSHLDWKYSTLRTSQLVFYAFKTFIRERPTEGYLEFVAKNKYWLDDYCLFNALKAHFTDASWDNWQDEDIRKRTPQALAYYTDLLSDEIELYKFEQFLFFSQWQRLKENLHQKRISLFGTLPFYVAYDSADCWANQKLFMLKDDLTPSVLVDTAGQPVAYNWKNMKQENFSWWQQRLQRANQLFDAFVVENFSHFHSYPIYGKRGRKSADWSVVSLFAGQRAKVVAEDFSVDSKLSRLVLKEKAIYTTTAQQKAFVKGAKRHQLKNHKEKSVAYLSASNTNSVYDWYSSLSKNTQKEVLQLINSATGEKLSWSFIKYLYTTKAEIVMLRMHELANNLSNSCDSIWQYMAQNKDFSAQNAEKLKQLCEDAKK
ncbi:MAG: 4-alpha-glucanotransferase [Clostridia bacterium]|nr:4-alpha-glucanotransferase [Clostridia bacterium]